MSLEGYVETAKERDRLRAELADRIAINQDKDRELARLNAGREQWWEQFQEADKERMNLRAELAMAQDGLAKGEAARLQAGGMEMEIQQLRDELATARERIKWLEFAVEITRPASAEKGVLEALRPKTMEEKK